MDDNEEVSKLYKVHVTAEWEVEVEAEDLYDAEDFAQDMVQGNYSWGVVPDYIDAWAEEITDGN